MPPPLLFDPSQLDLSKVIVSREQIYEVLPQRHEFALLDGVLHLDLEAKQMVAFHEVRPDEWWCKGHIPGRPLMPGVLIIEATAQTAAYYFSRISNDMRFIGFSGVDDVKFRGAVVPPCRLLILGREISVRPRRIVCDAQAIVGDEMVFEGRITGMPI